MRRDFNWRHSVLEIWISWPKSAEKYSWIWKDSEYTRPILKECLENILLMVLRWSWRGNSEFSVTWRNGQWRRWNGAWVPQLVLGGMPLPPAGQIVPLTPCWHPPPPAPCWSPLVQGTLAVYTEAPLIWGPPSSRLGEPQTSSACVSERRDPSGSGEGRWGEWSPGN